MYSPAGFCFETLKNTNVKGSLIVSPSGFLTSTTLSCLIVTLSCFGVSHPQSLGSLSGFEFSGLGVSSFGVGSVDFFVTSRLTSNSLLSSR